MDNYTKLYWLTRLENINNFFITCTVTSIALIVIISIYWLIHKEWDSFSSELAERIAYRKKLVNKRKFLFVVLFVCSMGMVLIPTQKEAVLIFAGGKTMDFIQQDTSIKKIPAQTTLLISTFFEKQIKELTEEDSKDKKTKK